MQYGARCAVRAGRLVLAGILPLALAAVAQAATPEPIESRNLSPLYASLGIPVLRSVPALQRGDWRVRYGLHWASHSVRVAGPDAGLELDGETRRHDLSLRMGVTERLVVEVNLPFVSHRAGELDSLIDDWHGFWGLPDGFRDDQPRDRLRFAYTARPGFALDESASGAGDAELGLSWRLLGREDARLAVFAQAKLATGDPDRFTGSGDRGLSAGVRATFPACVLEALACHAQLGVAEIGRIAYAPDADRRVAFASFALAWSLSGKVVLVGQLDAHGVVYDSRPLDGRGAPVWGTLGLRWSPGDAWTLDAGFSEDLAVGAAPDVTFMIGLSRGF